jgi:undecaprenyl diphosphate synthase
LSFVVTKKTTINLGKLPVHLAIVPDGNGRWAEKRGLPRLAGHQAGADNMLRLVEYLNEYPIKYVTLYGFSTENWGRPQEEVKGLFELLARFIDKYLKYIDEHDIQLRHIGRLQQLPAHLQESINRAVAATADNSRMVLNVAFNYGGRAEIIDAARRLITDGVRPEDIDEKRFEDYLYTKGVPPVDLLIRTGDEVRFSNFLIWQTAYSEYYLTEVLWPDFNKQDVEKALVSYTQRKRRFGAL